MTLGQLRYFMRLCRTLAASGRHWAGRERSVDDWKLLMLSAHCTGVPDGARPPPEVIEGLESEVVVLNIRESTIGMEKDRATSLIDYTIAVMRGWGIEVPEVRTGGNR